MTCVLGWINYDAARFACEHWHYSGSPPNSRLVKIGVWERQRFIGAVLYGPGANQHLGRSLGLAMTEVCELVRVALDRHETPVTQIVAESLRMLRTNSPDLRAVSSFADPEQNHVGRIYQAGNWLYLGRTSPSDEYIVNGRRMHGRALRNTRNTSSTDFARYENVLAWARDNIDPDAVRVAGSSKHRYVMPLDRPTRRRLRRQALPYPERP